MLKQLPMTARLKDARRQKSKSLTSEEKASQLWSAEPESQASVSRTLTTACLRLAFKELAPVVQRLDNAIHRINRYLVDKCWQNKPHYPVNSDLSGG